MNDGSFEPPPVKILLFGLGSAFHDTPVDVVVALAPPHAAGETTAAQMLSQSSPTVPAGVDCCASPSNWNAPPLTGSITVAADAAGATATKRIATAPSSPTHAPVLRIPVLADCVDPRRNRLPRSQELAPRPLRPSIVIEVVLLRSTARKAASN